MCQGPICTVTQNFTPIGVTVAEIAVTEHIHRITADLRPVYSDTTQLDVELSCVAINGPLISDKTHTSVAFVDKK